MFLDQVSEYEAREGEVRKHRRRLEDSEKKSGRQQPKNKRGPRFQYGEGSG